MTRKGKQAELDAIKNARGCDFCVGDSACSDCAEVNAWNPCPCGETNCDYKESLLYWHEALDRTHIARDHFYSFVETHPAVQHDEELKTAADNIMDLLGDFYQLVGKKYDNFEMKEDK